MGRAIYGHYSDNVAPAATITVNTGTEDATYPAANLADLNPSKPAQLTTTTGSWVFDWGAAQRVDWVLLPMHNLTAGLEVRIQMHTANSWGSPSLDTTITIPAYRDDGHPVGAWRDLTGVAGYLVGGYRYLRFAVIGTNAAAVKVGELLIQSNKRTLNPNISWGAQVPEQRLFQTNQTDAGVKIMYDLGTTLRTYRGELDTTDAGLAAVRAWWRNCRGPVFPFGFVLDEDVNDASMARWSGGQDPTLTINDRNQIPIAIEELSRGLVL
jgi:hypothetical protein